jgi:hypothetical protein
MTATAIDSKVADLNNQFEAELKERKLGKYADPESMLYHYTTSDGLKGIMDANEIWATNFRYVNDLAEFIYANELLSDQIHVKLRSARRLSRAVLQAILDTPDMLVGAVDIFIACFCVNGDLLSQWRAYGGRGGGYAVGLAANPDCKGEFGRNCRLY